MIRVQTSHCFRPRSFAPLQSSLTYPRFLSQASPKYGCHKQTPSTEEPLQKGIKDSAPTPTSSVLRSAFWSCRSTWRRAGINTLRCLIGCTVGDFTALWTLQSYYPELGMNSIMLASSTYSPKEESSPGAE
jgi:hypothetical protein